MNISDRETAKSILKSMMVAAEQYESLHGGEYEVREDAADRLDKILVFCYGLQNKHDCENPVVECPIVQKICTICVRFHEYFGLDQAEKKEFMDVLRYSDTFTVSDNLAEDDWLDVQFTIVDFWKRKEERDG